MDLVEGRWVRTASFRWSTGTVEAVVLLEEEEEEEEEEEDDEEEEKSLLLFRLCLVLLDIRPSSFCRKAANLDAMVELPPGSTGLVVELSGR